MVNPVKHPSSLEIAGIGTTYSSVTLMNHVIEKIIKWQDHLGPDLYRNSDQTERNMGNEHRDENFFRLHLTILLYRQGHCRLSEERIPHQRYMAEL
jgi:hypothetical protein